MAGSEQLDFMALEKGAKYEGGFGPTHKTARWFWESVHAMSAEEKVELLRFFSGCARAPMGGLGEPTKSTRRLLRACLLCQIKVVRSNHAHAHLFGFRHLQASCHSNCNLEMERVFRYEVEFVLPDNTSRSRAGE